MACVATFAVGIVTTLHAQDTRRVTGKVLDADTKEPLLGAVIRVKGTKVGTVVRRSDGEFLIDVPTNSSQILVVSLVGKMTEEVNVAG
ncbi:MAG: carboxypeptidase-like regulatory domain-containing protein, partial [Chlorobi bacterium]|nr:carboxypeptidase-like regulatory domain-containing protein [Chlorobiota bacterium]